VPGDIDYTASTVLNQVIGHLHREQGQGGPLLEPGHGLPGMRLKSANNQLVASWHSGN
jgi:hypothetical protein